MDSITSRTNLIKESCAAEQQELLCRCEDIMKEVHEYFVLMTLHYMGLPHLENSLVNMCHLENLLVSIVPFTHLKSFLLFPA